MRGTREFKNALIGVTNTIPNHYRKINNIYENDYNNKYNKYINTNTKDDYTRNGLDRSGNNFRNSTLSKNRNFQNIRPAPKLSDTNHYYNNTLNFINYKNNYNNQFQNEENKEIFTERSHNKYNKYQNINKTNIKNETTSINKLRNSGQNKNFNIKADKYINRNNYQTENDNIKVNTHNQKSSNINNNNNNKSMDSKIIVNKTNNDHDEHIINDNKGKIINLSNLNEAFSYATDKYSCFYVNKREKVKPRSNNNYQSIKINLSKYYINKKPVPKPDNNDNNKEYFREINKEIKVEPKRTKRITNSKTTYLEHKIIKTEKNKNPLKVNLNLTEENSKVGVFEPIPKEEPKEDNNKGRVKQKENNENIPNIPNKMTNIAGKINHFKSFKDNIKKNQINKYPYNTERISKIKEDLNIKNNEQKKESIKERAKEKINDKEKEKEKINDKEKEKEKIKEKEKEKIKNKDFDKEKRKMSGQDNNFKINNNNNINIIEDISNINKINNKKGIKNNAERNINIVNVINKKETLDNNDRNYQNLVVKNINERKEIKISNEPKKKVDYSFNHEQLSLNIKNKSKPINTLKIKSNDKLTFLNEHNKINSTNLNNKNKEEKKKTYKISSNVVNEQFYREKFMEKEINSDDENYLTISMQSLNDSNIMELANRYISDEEDLNKNEINDILNSKKERLN